MRLVVNPELYLATLLRRALTMAWTPGLVPDCARALQRVVEPPPLSWLVMIGDAVVRLRDVRRGCGAAARLEIAATGDR